MTTYEIEPELIDPFSQDPTSFYGVDIAGPEVREILDDVLATKKPLADSTNNPDIGAMRLYHFQGNELGSDLGRALEAQVFYQDWGQSYDDTRAEAQDFEDGSQFFVLVDCEGDKPRLAGSLRVIDAEMSPTETENFYRRSHDLSESDELPNELGLPEGRHGVWDIASVVMLPDYRGGAGTSWLYHAMYSTSIKQGVRQWISNINQDELRNLKLIGIPFLQVKDTDVVELPNKLDGSKSDYYRFCHAEVSQVGPAVEQKIEKLAGKKGMAETVMRLAMIGRYGSTAVASTLAEPEKIAS